MRPSPSKPITDLTTAVGFLKALAKSSEKNFPTTAERLRDVVTVIRAAQKAERAKPFVVPQDGGPAGG